MKRQLPNQTKSVSNRFLKISGALAITFALLLSTFFVRPFAVAKAAGGVSDSIIVELKEEPAAVWKAREEKAGRAVSDEQLQARRNAVTAGQNQFLSALQAAGVNYQIDGADIKDFNNNNAGRANFRFNLVMNGITLKVPAAAIAAIAAMPQVKKVHNNTNLRVLLDSSVPYINAPAAYGQVAELTAFDNHREGFEGQGMNIAVLDTGIDWSHPMFGGDPTPPRHGLAPPTAATNSNQKIIYYLPLTGLIDDFGHGTHASADAAGYRASAPGADMIPGTADDRPMHGVAPQARVMGYKVCSAAGTCPTAATVLSIEDSVSPVTLTLQPKPVAHVINLSLGGVGGPDDASATAASNAALMGTIVVASAGNEGPGEGTVGSPAAGRHVIAVGATTHPGAAGSVWSVDVLQSGAVGAAQVGGVTPARSFSTQNGFNRLRLYPMAGTPNPPAGSIAQRYSFINLFNLTDTYPASVRGRIALVKDAGLVSATFADQCNNAMLNGAIGMILISTTTNPTAVASTIPCAAISPDEGEILVDAISSTDNDAADPANGTVSQFPIRMNPFLTNVFFGETADFSSRGPVQGFGQVKPDVTAPGVGIVAATSPVGAPVVSMMDPTRYISANGTSFSGPQTAGAAALVKQAHLNWTPDMVRAALINTGTNLRSGTGAPKADGNSANPILEQGGGLIDVNAAVNAKALLGVTGDGIVEPALLASHSFGEVAILNNRIVNTREVTVTIKNVTGTDATYNLSTVNNRATDRDGVTTSNSVSSINVPANGSATFTTKITIDGDKVRNTDITQFQWYVVASRGTEKYRMPLYLRALQSLPSDEIASSTTTTYTGTVLAGDAGQQRDNETYVAEGATYVDVPFEVSPAGIKIDATLSWDFTNVEPAGVGLPDLDFLLFDPNGAQIGSSGNGSGPEHIVADVTIPGTYIYRAYGWANGPTNFEIESTILAGGAAPTVQPFAADFTNGAERLDFDGNYNLTWQPQGSVLAYEIEESTNGGAFSVVRTVDGNTTSAAFSNATDGTRSYRIRAITNGKIGKYVTLPSNTESVTVARRVETDVTNIVTAVNRSITFGSGATELVTALRNTSTGTLFPHVKFEIVSISSTGNSVTVANADAGGNGVSSPAIFDYSNSVGADFAPAEESANKTLRFNNPNTVLFQFTAKVKAHIANGTGAASGGSNGGSTGGTTGGGTGAGSGGTNNNGGGLLGGGATRLMRFTVNPLTQNVTVQLLQ